MPFQKGHKLAKGRPKGSSNEITKEIKEGIVMFVHSNRHKLNEWLDRVAEKNPEKALDIILHAADYAIPRYQRLEANIRADVTTIKIYEPIELLNDL